MTGRSVLGATAASVEVDGVRLAFDASGTGRALVCLHAIGHGASDFARIRERLQGRFRVVAPDWPGQGNSAADHVAPSAERDARCFRGVAGAVSRVPPAATIALDRGAAVTTRRARILERQQLPGRTLIGGSHARSSSSSNAWPSGQRPRLGALSKCPPLFQRPGMVSTRTTGFPVDHRSRHLCRGRSFSWRALG